MKPAPWWQTHPKELWTADERRAAIEAGWRPPRASEINRPLNVDGPVIEPLQQLPAGFGLRGKPEHEVSGVDVLLAKLGIKSGR